MKKKISYAELCAELGEPEVEKNVVAPTLAFRTDRWPCGCLRLVQMGSATPYTSEGIDLPCEVTFHPCEKHKTDFEDSEVE